MENLSKAKRIIQQDLPRTYSINVDESVTWGIDWFEVILKWTTSLYVTKAELNNILIDYMESKILKS